MLGYCRALVQVGGRMKAVSINDWSNDTYNIHAPEHVHVVQVLCLMLTLIAIIICVHAHVV